MRHNRSTKTIAWLLAALSMLSTLSACSSVDTGSEGNAQSTTAAPVIAETTAAPAETEPAYIYPEVTYGGDEFAMLNAEDRYNMIYHLMPAELTGESLSDTRYELNQRIGERFQLKLKETLVPYADIQSYAQQELLANNPVHDVFFLTPLQIATFMSSGYMHNLLDVKGLNIEEEWWNQTLREDGTLMGKYLYYLGGNYHIQGMEATTAVFFNKQMQTDLGLENPYQLVRDGKWTLDKVYELAAQAAQLNGDSSFAYSAGGNSTYGMVTMTNMFTAFVLGSEAYYVEKNSEDKPVIAFTDEHFINVCAKVANLTGAEGLYKYNDHIDLFKADRALMLGCEIKSAANELRDMDSEFGILPVPKYDEAQENYVSNMLWATHFLSIPVTCEDVDRAAIVMDALNYEAMEYVLPVYYDRVCYKGLRDEDSIDMLEIIRSTRYYNWGLSYGWLSSIEPSVNNDYLKQGNGNVAALANSASRVVQKLIDKTIASME